ncbi:glycoside hydrolase superfamily [Absidia repens]|uniref:chitinase n=1 Tax=Absidia repens TaxID=90262 RepID=A0A1X2IM57_9FUNG|nr:glycoside hydrolase superfamily [Absidia repens]
MMQASVLSWITLVTFFVLVNDTMALKLIQYWGQNSASTNHGGKAAQKSLSYYCQDDTQDILMISFVHQFGTNQEMAFDLSTESNHCKGLIQGTQLLDCPQMEKEIQTCQKKGKKILLSLGGASGSYGLASAKDGETWANKLWNTFGNGHDAKLRPFGKAVVDGFDLDIEAGSVEGYTAFVKTMRKHYSKDSSRTYYISGAPQCPFPDAWLGDALKHAWFDFYCSPKGSQFNYDTWENWAKKDSINKKVELYLGIPASPSAAGSGYLPLKELVKTIQKLKSSPYFGGVMMWDVSQAYSEHPNFAKAVAKVIHNGKSGKVDDDDDKGGNNAKDKNHNKDDEDNNDDEDKDNDGEDSDGDNENGGDQPTATTSSTVSTPTSGSSSKSKHHHHHNHHKHHRPHHHHTKSTSSVPTSTHAKKPTSTHTSSPSDESASKNSGKPKHGSKCSSTDTFRCIEGGFGQCDQGKWLVRPCNGSLKCKMASSGLVLCT